MVDANIPGIQNWVQAIIFGKLSIVEEILKCNDSLS